MRPRFAYSGDTDGTFWDGAPFHNEFEVLDAIRNEEPDFFVYLGDTVYADPVSRTFFVGLPPVTDPEEFRELYRINRREYPALPNLLRTTSTYAIWDDHEVQNDFAGLTVDPFLFQGGRRAFMEYMPIEEEALPLDEECPARPMYRTYRWGQHAEIFVLDQRTCRSASAAEACGADIAPTMDRKERRALADLMDMNIDDEPPAGCLATLYDPSRTMLGKVQKALFKDALLSSTATFKFVINEVPIQQLYALPYDRWEGYPAERKEILRFIRRNRIKNVVFLTTDFHVNLINGVYVDRFLNPRPVATEFVAGPVAELTLEEEIRYFSALLAGLDPDKTIKVVEFIVQLIGIDCWDLGGARPLLGGSGEPRFTYGLVEVDGESGEATISIRDRHGNIIPDRDPRDPGEVCARTISSGGRTRKLQASGPGGRRIRR